MSAPLDRFPAYNTMCNSQYQEPSSLDDRVLDESPQYLCLLRWPPRGELGRRQRGELYFNVCKENKLCERGAYVDEDTLNVPGTNVHIDLLLSFFLSGLHWHLSGLLRAPRYTTPPSIPCRRVSSFFIVF